jgi:oligoribonuclease NrnB/cAMP/cGMP phosphodiesterase (DHH superfamily)
MITFVVTHTDLDGAGVAVLITKCTEGEVNISFTDYDTIDGQIHSIFDKNKFDKDTKIIIADISPNADTCKMLDLAHKKGLDIHLFDHHVSRQWVEQYEWAVYDAKKCGTTLVFDYLANSDLDDSKKVFRFDEFAKTIEAWDLWLTKSPLRERAEKLHTLHNFIGMSHFINFFSQNPFADCASPFSEMLKYIEARKSKIIYSTLAALAQKCFIRIDSLLRKFVILHATEYVSEIADAILRSEDYKDLSYVVIYNPLFESCSLRGNPDVDVSTIAKKFGGGGHKSAAGFYFRTKENNENTIFKMLNNINFSQNT